jgi:F-type H+-transporting ATPase subunit gamma
MATLKEIQTKIGAVKKTQKITKAMNMVAASKLRGAQEKMEAFRPYASKFAEVLGSLAERTQAGEEHLPPPSGVPGRNQDHRSGPYDLRPRAVREL